MPRRVARGPADRQAGPPEADQLDGRRAEDPLRQDHAPVLRDIAEGREPGDVTTVREPGVMKHLEEKFAGEKQ